MMSTAGAEHTLQYQSRQMSLAVSHQPIVQSPENIPHKSQSCYNRCLTLFFFRLSLRTQSDTGSVGHWSPFYITADTFFKSSSECNNSVVVHLRGLASIFIC